MAVLGRSTTEASHVTACFFEGFDVYAWAELQRNSWHGDIAGLHNGADL